MINVDPLKKFKHLSKGTILRHQAPLIIPIMIWSKTVPVEDQTPEVFKAFANTAFIISGGYEPFGKGEFEITEEGELNFPGDPTFYPLVKLQLKNFDVFMYQYALVAVVYSQDDFDVVRWD